MKALNESVDRGYFDKGDEISDEDLVDLLDFYGDTYVALRALGPHFHQPWKEVHTRMMKLESVAHDRGIPFALPFWET